MTDEPKAKPQITNSDLSKLNTLLIEALNIAYNLEVAKRKSDENYAAILELVSAFVPEDADSGGELLHGVTVSVETKCVYDKTQALNWSIDEKQLPSAAALLKISKEAMPTAINLLVKAGFNPGLVFELDTAGYDKMLKSGTMTGCPEHTKNRSLKLSLKPAAIKTGAELAAQVEIIDDPEPAPEPAPETAV